MIQHIYLHAKEKVVVAKAILHIYIFLSRGKERDIQHLSTKLIVSKSF